MKKMKAKMISTALVMSMGVMTLSGCGASSQTTETNGTETTETTKAAEAVKGEESGDAVLEFYHGYYHEESEWPVQQKLCGIFMIPLPKNTQTVM